MTGGPATPPSGNSAERALDRHLELLREGPPAPGLALARRTVRTARWQRAVRAPLRIAGMIAGALVHGVVELLASGGRKAKR